MFFDVFLPSVQNVSDELNLGEPGSDALRPSSGASEVASQGGLEEKTRGFEAFLGVLYEKNDGFLFEYKQTNW